jgi:uncharacterized protein (TIGR02001 family)
MNTTLPLARLRTAFIAACALLPLNVFADGLSSSEAPAWTFPASITLVSDYIFRGQSQTWGKPALQAGIEADHRSGFYAGISGSNVSDHWLAGANTEIDLYAGFRGPIAGDLSFDIGAVQYLYPGADWKKSAFDGYNGSNSLDTFEPYAALTWKWLTLKAGVVVNEYFGWSNNNSPPAGGFAGDFDAGITDDTSGSHYTELNAAYPLATCWTLSAQLGRQVIRNSTGIDVTYGKVGLIRAFPHGISAGAFYYMSDEPDAFKDFLSLANAHSDSDIARNTVVFSLTQAF